MAAWALGLTGALALCAPTVLAAKKPGTPIAVAPGVPSHGRAWELTTSPDPNQVNFFFAAVLAPSGDAVAYYTAGSLDDYPFTHPLNKTAISLREPGGWVVSQPTPPFPPVRNGAAMIPHVLGPDNGSGIWTADLPVADPEEHPQRGLFAKDRYGTYSLLAEDAEFVGVTADLQRLVFTSGAHFLPADNTRRASGSSLYERSATGVRLLDIAADGTLISDCGSVANAGSADLNRVYFSTEPDCDGGVRIFLAEAGADAREVSASRCSSECGVPAAAYFVGATPSGSSAFFVTAQKLTDADANTHADLYRYDAGDDALTLISGGPGGPDLVPTTAAVKAAVDGSRVYFVAAEQTGPGSTGEAGIYLADSSGVHLVAPGSEALVGVSRDGRYALVNTDAPLEVGDTDAATDVYRYDAVGRVALRVSKGSVGGNGAVAAAAEHDPEFGLALIAGSDFRAMSEDGSRVFFVTAERLVPADTNSVGDVYEWADGDVGLISAGAGKEASTLLGASSDGATVLFKTADTLLPLDRDVDDADFYVARVGGGFPEAAPPAPICPCDRSTPDRDPLDRSEPPSAESAGGRIGLRPIAPADRRRFARSGWISLLAEVPRAGTLSASARARLGGRPRTIASAEVRAPAAGPVRLRMRLSRAARARLAAGGSLRVGLRLMLAGSRDAGHSSTFELHGG